MSGAQHKSYTLSCELMMSNTLSYVKDLSLPSITCGSPGVTSVQTWHMSIFSRASCGRILQRYIGKKKNNFCSQVFVSFSMKWIYMKYIHILNVHYHDNQYTGVHSHMIIVFLIWRDRLEDLLDMLQIARTTLERTMLCILFVFCFFFALHIVGL